MTDERPPLLYPGPRRALLRRIGAITVEELHALDTAVRALRDERRVKDVDKGFFYAWWEGPRLDRAGEDEVQELFSAVLVALATGLTGIDVERFGTQLAPKRRGFGLDGLVELFLRPRPSRELQDTSIALIDGHLAPWDPRLAVVAVWNMACAAAFRNHVSAGTVATLEAPWRQAIGEPPA
jgi:hypothetical protein